VHHLLINGDAKRVRESPVTFETGYRPLRQDKLFGYPVKCFRLNTRLYNFRDFSKRFLTMIAFSLSISISPADFSTIFQMYFN
jgi:hypothetical protein